MFNSLFSTTASNLPVINVLICIFVAIFLGLLISVTYMLSGKYSKSFAISLVLLPVLVEIVIIMVNGNLGTGVAVAGAFSLIRFRSTPGTAKEICSIFFAMAIGLAVGTGYVTYAIVITIIVCLVLFILSKTKFGESKSQVKFLKVTIPENLNYTNVFDDIFSKYVKNAVLQKVKTSNLGSLYELSYDVVLADENKEKDLIDEIRCRNGNLPIICFREQELKDEL